MLRNYFSYTVKTALCASTCCIAISEVKKNEKRDHRNCLVWKGKDQRGWSLKRSRRAGSEILIWLFSSFFDCKKILEDFKNNSNEHSCSNTVNLDWWSTWWRSRTEMWKLDIDKRWLFVSNMIHLILPWPQSTMVAQYQMHTCPSSWLW